MKNISSLEVSCDRGNDLFCFEKVKNGLLRLKMRKRMK